MIVVVDYGRGNLFSIGQALRHLGAAYRVSDDAACVAAAERIILPGVGAFGDGMAALGERGLVDAIAVAARAGTPLLGICLGMQMLCTESEEFGRHDGLGLIPGKVRRLPDGESIRIPNVGWRALRPRAAGGYFEGMPAGTMAYFVHSYAPVPEFDGDIAATIDVNGADVAIALRRDNIVGYQFHPEKSGAAGLSLLRRFLDLPAARTQELSKSA